MDVEKGWRKKDRKEDGDRDDRAWMDAKKGWKEKDRRDGDKGRAWIDAEKAGKGQEVDGDKEGMR